MLNHILLGYLFQTFNFPILKKLIINTIIRVKNTNNSEYLDILIEDLYNYFK